MVQERVNLVPRNSYFLLDAPPPAEQAPVFLLTHGYGMNAKVMLDLCRPVVPEGAVLASLEAPNQHYLSEKPGSDQVGFNWGTRARWQDAVEVHHRSILAVLETLQADPARTVLLGFSQPVGLNYRFAATYPAKLRGVIGICGGIPRDWEEADYQQVTAALLHIARDQDEYYPVETVEKFPARLGYRVADVEFHLLPGGHRFPSRVKPVIAPWLARLGI
jgi:predicted esterase